MASLGGLSGVDMPAVNVGGVSIISFAKENEAKAFTRILLKQGHRVSAGTVHGVSPERSIPPDEVVTWLTAQALDE